MKPYIPYSILAAALSCGLAHAVTSYTIPVGFVSLGAPTGPALLQETDIAISVPLLQAPEYAGTVLSVAGNVITITGTPAFTASPAPGSWMPTTGPLANIPYIFQLGSGVQNGVIGLINSNTVNTLTVALQPGHSLTGVLSGDKITIRKANTVANLFAGNTLIDGLELGVYDGATPGINLAYSTSYIFIAGNWYDSGSLIADNIVLYPGEGLLLRNSATGFNQTSLVVTGEVPVANSKIVLNKLDPAAGQDNRIAFITATGQAVGAAGFTASASDGDEIYFFDDAAGINKAGASIVFVAGNWYDAGSLIVDTTFFLESGRSYVYRREASVAVGDTTATATPSYVPGL